MRESKRKRLEAKGWRVGSTAQFLSFSPEEAAYVELKIKLASKLRQGRVRRGLTQGDLAKLVKSSQSRSPRWKPVIPLCRWTSSFEPFCRWEPRVAR